MSNIVELYRFGVPSGIRSSLKALNTGNLLQMEKDLVPRFKEAMQSYMQDVVEATIQSSGLKQRKGTLFKSLRSGIRVTGSNLTNLTGVYKGIYYADILTTGGTITPKNAKVLTLPLPAALRPDGTPKLSGPRAWKRFGTFSWKSPKTGQGYLVYKNAAGKLVFLYIYVDRVKVPKRLFLADIHNGQMGALMDAWTNIVADEMMDIDMMSVVNSKGSSIKKYGKSKTARYVSGTFRSLVNVLIRETFK